MSLELSELGLPWVVLLFLGAAIVIGVAGTRLSRLADRIADATGLGQAVIGAVLLGGTTSLPGSVASITAAVQDHPELAVSNAVGGIAVQTLFLALADLTYRKANLEHAAASIENLLQAALLLTLLTLPLLARLTPEWSLATFHPISVVMLVGYVFGVGLVRRTSTDPPWRPNRTADTQLDEPAQSIRVGSASIWAAFFGLAAVVGVAGFLVAESGLAIASRTGFSESLVGTYLTSIATSLPELVTSLAAVRQGALTLAVGGIIGGNAFDVLFVAFSDLAYTDGSIYAASTDRQLFTLALSMLLTGLVLLGLVRRERRGPANVGFETVAVVFVYACGVLADAWRG